MAKEPKLIDQPGTVQVLKDFSEGPVEPQKITLVPMAAAVRQEIRAVQKSAGAKHRSSSPVGGKWGT